MRILIVGAGQVGYNIAARLVEENHDVIMIERDEEVLKKATDNLDIKGIRGHGARPKVLDQAGIGDVDMLLAVTNSDEVNMVACINASILGKPGIIKVARVRDESYLDPRLSQDKRLPIDLAINPERVTADKILYLLRFPSVNDVSDFAQGKAKLIGIQIEATSHLAGLRFMEFGRRFLGLSFLVGAIQRGKDVIIPRGSDVVLPGDEIFVVVKSEDADLVLTGLGIPAITVSRVMISGATRLGRYLAEDLIETGMHPKVIDPDAQHARFLANALPEATVLCGEPTDASLLEQENISEMQAFIACSSNEETNVMSALLAQRLGAERLIVTTNRPDYQPLVRSIGADVSLSPQQVAISSILHFIRHGHVIAAQALGHDSTAEAIEFEAQLSSEAVGVPLRNLRLPQGCLIACIEREGQVIVPRGDSVIQDRDHVLVIAQHHSIPAIEKMLARGKDVR